CHGSFQGKGGFRLSLFGYDFEADHKALTEEIGDEGAVRVDRDAPANSLLLNKPTNADLHEGGLRYVKDGWEYHLFRRWIESGAKFDQEQITPLVRLEISPSEIVFSKDGETVQLQVVAVWKDGTKEDVTPLCRFQTNNEQNATVTDSGLVTAGDPGDTHVVVFYDNGVTPIPVLRPVSDLAGENYPQVATPTRIDELVIEKLRKLGVLPSDLCTDAEFLRRAKLDLTGTLPTPVEVERFLADSAPDKRAKKIDELLKTLTFREREIIKLRYGLTDGYCYTLEEVGRIFKVTRERVRQIEAKAVAKLQHPVRSAELAEYVADSPVVAAEEIWDQPPAEVRMAA
ncbi:MAG: hypothetical protein DCC67_13340, partial [Planctomycetota bacterium]